MPQYCTPALGPKAIAMIVQMFVKCYGDASLAGADCRRPSLKFCSPTSWPNSSTFYLSVADGDYTLVTILQGKKSQFLGHGCGNRQFLPIRIALHPS